MPPKTLHSNGVYYVIQWVTHLADKDPVWADASVKYWGESKGRDAALAQRDQMRETFGKESVRVVRREEIVLESVED